MTILIWMLFSKKLKNKNKGIKKKKKNVSIFEEKDLILYFCFVSVFMKRKLSELSIQNWIKLDHCKVNSYTFFLFYWFISFKTNQRKLEQLNSKKIKEKPRSLINIKMTNILMLLRKCCNHPYLLEYPFNPENDELLIDENLVKVSGKMMVLDQMLPALKARGHKVWESNESELLSDK